MAAGALVLFSFVLLGGVVSPYITSLWLGLPVAILGLLAAFVIYALIAQGWDSPARTAAVAVGTTVAIVGAAWLCVAALGFAIDIVRLGQTGEGWPRNEAVLHQRQAALDEWDKLGAPTVAVTVSGGGYRAAAFHAGVLSLLEEAGIPIRLLSTVSGGSIVGGAYAIGWTPQAFIARLKERPRIVDDFMNPFAAYSLLLGAAGTGDVLNYHLSRVFFGLTGIEDTGPPLIVINTTEFRSGERISFWPGDGRPVLNKPLKLGTAVAASAAFPGAFSPIKVDGISYYMDGGVRENLGLEGLEQFLNERRAAPTPRILLISDATAGLTVPYVDQRPSLSAAAFRAMDILYADHYQEEIDRYMEAGVAIEAKRRAEAKKQDQIFFGIPDLRPTPVPADTFWRRRDGDVRVFLFSLSRQVTADEDVSALLRYAAALDTLEELSEDDLEIAFWAGRWIANSQLESLCGSVGPGRCRSVGKIMMPSTRLQELARQVLMRRGLEQ
ncbi:patatin-like phospholipase family protein [Bradyrhizobium erythrophlei]|uniref:patatin-like phospholipase family protein n=1 Tax=Bradyrhizobium erythrophlei TaxID=1437360 RepID=UPI0035ECD4C7